MSKTIDSRVVEMQFNNKQFERDVSTSMSTLDRLKRSLNLDGASKGLDSVSAAAKNCDMSGLSGAVETVRLKFSALEVMAVTALVNITNSAINAGKKVAKSLTIDPIADGFKEYEMVLNAVQTTMAGTGKTAEEVEEQLKRLDQYADDTIYSTNDMLSNLPKFTNAGVELEKATTAMIGIANATALAGGDARSASIAFYNLGQSIGTGYLTRMDYNSINNAGIATMEWKNQMIEAALAQGKLTKVGEDAYKAGKKTYTLQSLFIDGLQEQWASADVLMNVFEDYGDVTTEIGKKAQASAQDLKTYTMMMESLQAEAGTGWKDTWQILFGDLEEAKVLWTSIGNAIGKVIDDSAEARNKVLQDWKDLGGRDLLIESFTNAFEALGRVITPIKEAFRDFFPAKTGDQLFAVTEALHAFTEKIKIGDETSDKLRRTFAGLFAVLDLVKQGIGFVFNVAGELFGLFSGPAAGGILGVTASIGDLLVKLNQAVTEGNVFKRAFETLKDVFTTVAEKITDAINRIKEAFGGFKSVDTGPIDEFSNKAEKSFKPFTRIAQIFGAAFEAIVKVLEWAAPIVAKLGSIIGDGLGALADKVSYSVQNMEFNEILDLINTGLFGAILLGIRNFIKSLTDITSNAGGFIDGLKGILDGVRGSLEAYQSNLKSKTLLTIASAIGILAAALVVLSLIDSEKLSTSMMAITILFVELAATMIVIQKAMGGGKMANVSVQMIAMSTAILILASAMKKLADLDWEGIAKGTVGIAALAAVLVIAANSLDKSTKGLVKGSIGLIAFAAAILIMSKAVESMSKLSWEELAKGLTGLTVILAEVVAVTRLMGDPKRTISTGIGMIALGAAMLIFAEAVKRMGNLSWEKIGKGLATMAGALTAVTIAMKLLPKGMINKATGMVLMGAALLIIGEAVEKMGSMSWEEIARGLATLAGSLAAITLALNLMPKGMMSKAIGLIGVAAAITILIKPLREMGSMSWEEITKGLVTLAGSMTILAVALNAMQKAIPGAAAMMIVAPALVIMAGVLKILGGMPLSEIGIGLLTLAGVFVMLGAAALILKPLVPTIIGLGAAIALLGIGVAAVGVGVLAFATGLTALSVSATAAAGAIVIIGSAILSLIPIFFEKIGEGIIALGNVIINGAPIIKDAFLVLLASALEAITEAAPMIAEAALTLLTSLLDALVKYTPGIVERVFDFLIGILNAIATKLPQLIKAGVDVLMAFFSGVIDALSGIDVEVLLKGIAGIGLLSAIMVALAAVATLIPGAMIGVLGMGVVIAELALVLAAIGALAQLPGLKWLINEGAELMQGIGNAIGSFIGGIVGGFMSGVSSSFPKIGADLSAFMTNIQPFIEGASKIDASMMDGVKALAEVILILTAANILDGLTSWFTGGSSLSGFADELVPFGKAMKAFSDEISGIDSETVSNAAIAGKTLAEMAATLPNSGGVLGFFAGENDMEAFGDQLVPFGRAMKAFADEVTGLNSRVVTEAATAGKALAEMADTVPNSGGVVGFFAGENDIEAFGKQLIPFGKAMKDFSFAVTGLRADVIQNSVTAGQALMELANTVPNTGGVVSWFTGDNDLATFGEQLVPFGKAMKDYSMAVTGLNSDVVVNSANAAKALVELSNNLPNSGGIVSWFTGDNDIAAFGTQLVSFGQSFASYYASVSTVNTSQLSSVVDEFKKLVDLATGIKSVDTSGMSTFSKNLTALGNAGIDGFIEAFTNANSRVSEAASNMLTIFINASNDKQSTLTSTFTTLVQNVLNAIKGKTQEFNTTGQTIMTNFITGIKTKESTVLSTINQMISGALTAIKNKYHEFNTVGQTMMTNLITGIKTKDSTVTSTFILIVSSALTSIKNKYTDFYNAGRYLVEGFAAGITENTFKAEAAARAMAKAAARAAERELDVNSPSKVGYGIGNFFGLGFVKAIRDYVSKAYDASSEMAVSAKNGLSKAISKITDVIDENVDVQPTIRPVLDLSDVEIGANRLNALFSRTRAMSISTTMNRTSDEGIQNGGTKPENVNTYQFTQNNYSPKPLSRIEIYRQTKNQLSAMKGLVET